MFYSKNEVSYVLIVLIPSFYLSFIISASPLVIKIHGVDYTCFNLSSIELINTVLTLTMHIPCRALYHSGCSVPFVAIFARAKLLRKYGIIMLRVSTLLSQVLGAIVFISWFDKKI